MKKQTLQIFCLVAAIALSASCKSSSSKDSNSPGDLAPTDATVPTSVINEVRQHADAVTDEPFTYDASTLYRTTDVLPELDITAIAVLGGKVYAAAAGGLYRLNAGETAFENIYDGGAVSKISKVDMPDTEVIFAVGNSIVVIDDGGTATSYNCGVEVTTLLDSSPDSLSLDGQPIYGATTNGLVAVSDNGISTECRPIASITSRVNGLARLKLNGSSPLALATASGLVFFTDGDNLGGTSNWTYPDTNDLFPADVTGDSGFDPLNLVAISTGGSDDTLFVANRFGVSQLTIADNLTASASDILLPGKNGLPTGDNTALTVLGDRWLLGHVVGASALESSGGSFTHIDHYTSMRWLPSRQDEITGEWIYKVNDVALETDGTRWIATSAGISRIDLLETTFADKAEWFEQQLQDRFWRLGFVGPDANIDDPWNPTEYLVWDSDNDGLWTQMMIGAWCMAYAATGEERYYTSARRAMEMMMLQIDIPAVSFEEAGLARGFITRSLVRDDEGVVYDDKTTQDNWHKVDWTDGHSYYWKDDTSSDETTGHFFGFPLYYDLCAKDDAEREKVAEHAGALAGYIVDNGYQLIDLDGEKTTHGHWQPEVLAIALDGLNECVRDGNNAGDCAEAVGGGGWLNGIQILGHLLSTWHMTGDDKFYEAYEYLITEHRYDELVPLTDNTFTVTSDGIANHSDHELAFLAYFTLLRYEPNEERRAIWLQSMLDTYQYELAEHNPLWASFIALASEDGYELEPAIASLEQIPQDLRQWGIDNSHRLDAEVREASDRFNNPQFDTVFPYDEIRTIWWNGNFYVVQSGSGEAHGLGGPMLWLLPYYTARYAGIIVE